MPTGSGEAVPQGRFWAKLGQGWHPLVAHSADVAAVFERLLWPDGSLGARLAASAGTADLTRADRARLTLLVALHDVGKAQHGFQDRSTARRGHVVPVLCGLHRATPLFERLAIRAGDLVHDEREAGVALLAAVIAHHGRPRPTGPFDSSLVPLWRPNHHRDPIAEVDRLLDCAQRWSGVEAFAGEPFLPVTPAFTHLFAGIVTLADWIGSTQRFFPFEPGADDDPDAYWAKARQQAEDACRQVGVVPRPCRASLAGLDLLQRAFPATFAQHRPTALQGHVATAALPGPGARVLIESETGSGKTEAALALYARLRAAGLVDGLYFALPTRATASAMLRRVEDAVAGLYDEPDRPAVILAVGGKEPDVSLDAAHRDDPSDAEEEKAETVPWTSSHHKARLAGEVAVGTLDQALLAAVPVKHANLRLAGLCRLLLVVDELHSYDAYSAGLLRHLIDLHTAAGGLVLCMSATLSHAARRRLGGGVELDRAAAEALAYPCYAVSHGAGWDDHRLASTGREKAVGWRNVGEAESLALAANAARAGARVLVLRNTVGRAREAMARLPRELLWECRGHCPPYHARYTPGDRLALDEAVRGRFGKDAATIAGGCILVATQVAEQSLDVDFDLLVTDLCPVDVLLQRLGRVHRHTERDAHRPEPCRGLARALVVGPEDGFAGLLEQKGLALGWGRDRPYFDYRHGELTQRLIAARPEVVIPRHNRALVEAVYHPAVIDSLCADEPWRGYRKIGDLHDAHGRFRCEQAKLPFDRPYHECSRAFDNELQVDFRTRLGDSSVRVDLPRPAAGWFSDGEARQVDLPAWWLPGRGQSALPRPVPRAELGRAGFALGDHQYWYAEDGWRFARG